MKTHFTLLLATLALLTGSRLVAASASGETARADEPAQANPSMAGKDTPATRAGKRSAGQPGQSANAAAEKAPDPNSYANKETYPHSSSPDVSPTALMSGGNAGGGGGSTYEVGASVVEGRIKEWHLSATDIQADLDRGEGIVRTRELGANAPTGPANDEALHTLINNRLVADIDTVRVSGQQEVRNGEVTLRGKVHSAELLGRVMAITLDTPGVTKVTSEMKIDPSEPGTQRDDAAKIPGASK